MRHELSPTNIHEFRTRFGTFHDSVVHSVKFDLFSKFNPKLAYIMLGVQDLSKPAENRYARWINLTFEVEHVTKFGLYQGRNYLISVIYGLNIHFFGTEIYLDFFPRLEEPSSSNEIESNLKSKSVEFVVIGKKCFWYTSEYWERA